MGQGGLTDKMVGGGEGALKVFRESLSRQGTAGTRPRVKECARVGRKRSFLSTLLSS